MSNVAHRTPDIEFRRKLGVGHYKTYGHLYWKPFIVAIFGRVIIGKKHLVMKGGNK